MTDLEIELTHSHHDLLRSTRPLDRGYIFVKRHQNLLIATHVIPAHPGKELIVKAELSDVMGRILCEKDAAIPYINAPDENSQHGDAYGLKLAEEELRMDKFAAYGVINGELNFYRINIDGLVTTAKTIPFRLKH